MVIAGLTGLLEAEVDPLLKPKENAGAIITGLTAAGVGMGALIGALFKKEKTIYQKGRFQIDISFPISIRGNNGASIAIFHLEISY
jgi:hypothetical protein